MVSKQKLKIGDLLVKKKLLTTEQLQHALTLQTKNKVIRPLGEVCIALKYLTKSDLLFVLREHHKDLYIGELLINLGLVNDSQMKEALEVQKVEKNRKIGQILVGKGFLSELELVDSLSLQLGIPKIIPDINLIDKKLFKNISQAFLQKNEFIPAFKEANTLTVIMADPLDETTLHSLENFFNCRIEPAIATRSSISSTVGQYFHKIELGTEITRDEDVKDLIIGSTHISEQKEDSIIEVVNFIISNAITDNASDIHIEPLEKGLRVRYRIDGILYHKTDLPRAIIQPLTTRIKVLCGLDISEKRRHQDGRIEAKVMGKEVDLRVSTFVSMWGENIVIRLLHRQSALIDLNELGFSPGNKAKYTRLLEAPSGIILATGPTGSGKTTTLYASLKVLNSMDKMIITVEDPVEYTMDGVVQGKIDAKVGLNYMDFLKAMMRQDPDVLMIGEIRDPVAAEAAIQAALTGHKVFSTFHTDDTTGALLRLMDMGIDTFLISSTLVSVVAQRLVRILCERCKEPSIPDKRVLSGFSISELDPTKYNFCRPRGCAFCHHTGFKGRTAIHELLVVNDAIRDAILARQPTTKIRLIAREKANLVSMRDDGFYKSSLGVTTLEEVVRAVYFNESDELTPYSADELIALCEDDSETAADSFNLPYIPRQDEY